MNLSDQILPSEFICEPFEDQLNLYVDGELPSSAQSAAFAHLADCASCRQYLDSLLTFRRMVGDEQIHVPPSFDEAFMQRLAHHRGPVVSAHRRAERQAKMRRAVPVIGRALAACVIIALIVGNIVSTGVTEPTPSGDVAGEEELVNFPSYDTANRDKGAVYVFYPGLTIEADNTVEPVSAEPL